MVDYSETIRVVVFVVFVVAVDVVAVEDRSCMV